MKRSFGWRKDKPDHRDRFLSLEHVHVPPAVDFRKDTHNLDFPIYDQGQLGSCTANAISAALVYVDLSQKEAAPVYPSRLFVYYEERRREGTVNSDAGAEIRDGLKVVAYGYCSEHDWPYEIDKFDDKPPRAAYDAAKHNRALSYLRVYTREPSLKAALAAGYPVIVGFSCYEGLESPETERTGVVPMPGPDEQQIGGHAVLCCGYDDSTRRWLFRNSWGDSWGDGGYGYLPYGYLDNPGLAGDFWTIRKDT